MLDIQGKSNDTIRKKLAPYIGKTVKIKCNLGRNKYETYEATIKKIYNFLDNSSSHDGNYEELDLFVKSKIWESMVKIYTMPKE